ncbi:MAG: hypothetical protein QXL91_03500 [Candidatus Bathyarchaeia archaeon]
MGKSYDGVLGVISFAFGGAFLLFDIFQFLNALSDPSIGEEGATFFGVIIGFIAFLLIGLGLMLMLQTAHNQETPKVEQ